jgi:retron-type reverse transcriptase
MLERIIDRRNIEKALIAVERNARPCRYGRGGAAGIDNLQSDELRQFLNTHYQGLRQQILAGTYKPNPVRKVEIPKPQGGVRMLGIPTVTDRMLQQAIHQVLSPVYEEQFDKNSFGFRPGKNAHQAVMAAKEYINAGHDWIIELDLEKFFDTVNHQKLMALLSNTVKDKRTLKLINAYLRSGIMEGGMVSQRIEGTPQGSPLASRTHSQTLSSQGGCKSNAGNFNIIIKSIIFMKNGKGTEYRVSETYQQCVHDASKRKASTTDCGEVDREVWCLTSAGLSLYPTGQGDQREDAGARKFCGLYCKTTTNADQAGKEAIEIKEVIDQQSGPYRAGRIFSKEGSCPKRRNKLRYHLPMTGCGSKSFLRSIISLSRPMLFSLNKLQMN